NRPPAPARRRRDRSRTESGWRAAARASDDCHGERAVIDAERRRRQFGLCSLRDLAHLRRLELHLGAVYRDTRAGLCFDDHLALFIVDADREAVGLEELDRRCGVGRIDLPACPEAAAPDGIAWIARLELDPDAGIGRRQRKKANAVAGVGRAGLCPQRFLAHDGRDLHLQPAAKVGSVLSTTSPRYLPKNWPSSAWNMRSVSMTAL